MANYYVRPDGNNSNTGLTHDQAWATADKVRSTSFSSGDSVYFICDATFYPSNTIYAWGGTSGSPNTIGAYYMDSGSEVHGVSGNRPKLDGASYTIPSNAYFGSTDSWRGLVQANAKDYVYIDDLHIYESGFHGIQFVGDLTNYCANFRVKNVKSEGAWRSNIIVTKNPTGPGEVDECDISYGGYGFTYSGGYGGYQHWPGGISIAHSPYGNVVIKNNYLHHIWGEAVIVWCNPYKAHLGSGYVDVYDNVFWNNYAAGIYFDAVNHCTAYRNLILGAGPSVADNRFFRFTSDGRGWNGYGLWISAEIQRADPELFSTEVNDIDIYNNFVAGCRGGYRLASEFSAGDRTMENVFLYHNHLIGNYYGTNFSHSMNGYTFTNVAYKNNIIWTPGDCLGSDGVELSWHSSKFDWDYNAWTAARTYQNGANDIVFDGNLTKTTGWQALTAPIDAENFRLLTGCNCIGAGVSV